MSWRLFNWGSRGPHYDIGGGVYVPTILIPQSIRVTLFGRDARGDELLNSFAIRAAHTPVILADCTLACQTVHDWAINATDGYKLALSNTVVIDRVIATASDVFEGPQAELAIGQAGTKTGDPLPSEVTLSVKKFGTNIGRSRRGRWYMWPFTVDDIMTTDPNRVTSSYRTIAATVCQSLIAALTAAGMPMVIYSTVRAALYDVSGMAPVDDLIDHQGRRAAGRGR